MGSIHARIGVAVRLLSMVAGVLIATSTVHAQVRLLSGGTVVCDFSNATGSTRLCTESNPVPVTVSAVGKFTNLCAVTLDGVVKVKKTSGQKKIYWKLQSNDASLLAKVDFGSLGIAMFDADEIQPDCQGNRCGFGGSSAHVDKKVFFATHQSNSAQHTEVSYVPLVFLTWDSSQPPTMCAAIDPRIVSD
ncbi:MAG TPA: hypothetical protein VNU71_06260 [Burkholderiaceae bacterium]|nr:hypothetical protein [Burkholderiaceae bacterium]